MPVSCRTALAALFFLPAPLLAAPATSIPNVAIYGRAPSALGEDLFDRTQNANRGSLSAPGVNEARASLARIPGAVDLVPAENYQDGYAVHFGDVLKQTPGVFAQQRYGEEVRLSIRGSGLARNFHLRGITLLQDGVPYNLADGSGDFQEIDPLTSRYVEVYKGGNGLRYGAASLGGAVNVVTPTGNTAPARNMLRVEGGSHATGRIHGAFAREFEQGDAFLALTGLASEGWRENSGQMKGRLSTNAAYKVNDKTETRFYLTYNNLNQRVPDTRTLANALNNPEGVGAVNDINNYARDIRSLRVANKTTYRFNAEESIDFGLFGWWKSLYHPIFQVLDQESANYGVFTRYQGRHDMAGHRNETTFGLSFTTGKTDALQYVNAGGSRGALTGNSDQRADSVELYGENQFFVTPDLALSLGAQIAYSTRDYDNILNPALSDTNNYFAFNPKVGALWDFAPGQQLFANASRSQEAPTYSELVQTGVAGFVSLEAQKAWTLELGTRGKARRFAWDATVYHAWVEDELLGFTIAPGIPAATFNAGSTIHKGVELGLQTDIGTGWLTKGEKEKLILSQTYTYSDFTFDGDRQYGNNTIAGVPPHFYQAELRYDSPHGFYAAPNVEWAPTGGFIDHANTQTAPGYAVMGFKAGYAMGNGATLFFDARNLADERYVSNYSTLADARTASNAVYFPGEGRSFFGGVKVEW
jgi:iron complex outermembrane receptor protein